MKIRHLCRTTALIVVTAAMLLCAGCQKEKQPDYTPIGNGLRALAIAFVTASVVTALAALIQHESQPNDSSRNEPRRREEEGGGGNA